MGTNTRPELSDKNKWWISKHRYYELRHFCLQYPEWREKLMEIDGLGSHSPGLRERVNEGSISDPTPVYAEAREYFQKCMDLVRKAAFEASGHQFWYFFIVDAVTEGKSYDMLDAMYGIMPVSRNEWYTVYRKFFWYLDKLRD